MRYNGTALCILIMMFTDETIAAAVARGLETASDGARPGDLTKSARGYFALSDEFRQSASQHLQSHDLPQASNKAWGMVAETIKAISAHHGGIIHTHRSIWEVQRALASLVRDSGDADTAAWMDNAFSRARSLHTNFYENEETEEEVGEGFLLCEGLSEQLYVQFWPNKPVL